MARLSRLCAMADCSAPRTMTDGIDQAVGREGSSWGAARLFKDGWKRDFFFLLSGRIPFVGSCGLWVLGVERAERTPEGIRSLGLGMKLQQLRGCEAIPLVGGIRAGYPLYPRNPSADSRGASRNVTWKKTGPPKGGFQLVPSGCWAFSSGLPRNPRVLTLSGDQFGPFRPGCT